VPFDGSSIRGFQTIHESDMLIIPDPTTAILDPFTVVPTLSLVCNIAHPGPAGRKRSYTRDPRYIAQKAEAYLRSSGIADTSYFGPESEFFIFDNVRYLGHRMPVKGGYFPVAPNDTLQDLRTEMVLLLEELGVPVEAHHHEVGGPGQAEIDIHYNTLLKTADHVMLYKYVVKNTARRHGKTVTFMPKPVFGENGSGMHVHQSLWKGEKPLFCDGEGYAGLSQTARYYIGGLLTHAPALLAMVASTTNSYKRLVPGYEAPVNLVFSQGNRSAAVRIPLTECPSAKRVEFRPPDPTANPYLAFSALLMAGLDALESDHSFLLEGNVFTTDMLEQYVELKRAQSDEVRLHPTPIEFALYYDA
jgi:glutamine synthetase